MKRLLVLLLLSLFRQSIGQTYVLIPDPNFAAYLQTIVPTAMSGNSLNISHTLVTIGTKTIDATYKNVSNLSGVEYFSSLTHLICQSAPLTTLLALPDSLQFLNLHNNQLLSLPNLPNSLKIIYCSYGKLTTLPTLPDSLTQLACSSNSLSALPALPSSLTFLNCSYNLLSSLPPLPNSVNYLDCAGNSITNIASLPNQLKNFDCSYNLLSNLPLLPNSTQTIHCNNNMLTSLQNFPNSMREMWCFYNSLTSLPNITPSLFHLNCSNNLLSSLPTLDIPSRSLGVFHCQNNNIECFPPFPESIFIMDINNNPFDCLPNYLPIMSQSLLAIPLCTVGNSNGCTPAGFDEPVISNIHSNIYPNPSNGQFIIETSNLETKTIQLFDLNGTLLFEQLIKDKANIAVPNINDGIYSLVIKTINTIANKKLVIVH